MSAPQSLVAARDLRPGQVIREEDLIVQAAPGTGNPRLRDAIPRRQTQAKQAIRGGDMISWNLIRDAA